MGIFRFQKWAASTVHLNRQGRTKNRPLDSPRTLHFRQIEHPPKVFQFFCNLLCRLRSQSQGPEFPLEWDLSEHAHPFLAFSKRPSLQQMDYSQQSCAVEYLS